MGRRARRDRGHDGGAGAVPLSRHARKRLGQRAIPAAVVTLARRHGVPVDDPEHRGLAVRLVTAQTAARVKALRGWVGLRLVLSGAGTVVTAFRDDWRRDWRQW